MSLPGQIYIILIAVHILTVAILYILKQSKISQKFKSSTDHPANTGKVASQIGGLVITPIVLFACFYTFNTLRDIPYFTQLVFCVPFVFLFLIGLVDDLKPIPAWIRLTIHITNAISVTIVILEITQYSGLGQLILALGFLVPSIFMVLAISWFINAVNFIDGMDLFLVVNIIPGCLLLSALGFSEPEFDFISIIFLIFSSALLGFAWFNRPKASVYMGDAGTLCIGFLLGSAAIYILAKYGSVAGFIPFTYIMVDTTYTLIQRASKRQNILKSHNHHAYQVAIRNGKSENSVRINGLILSVVNTGLAQLCFVFEHELLWQMVTAGIALSLSTLVFVSFKKQNLVDA